MNVPSVLWAGNGGSRPESGKRFQFARARRLWKSYKPRKRDRRSVRLLGVLSAYAMPLWIVTVPKPNRRYLTPRRPTDSMRAQRAGGVRKRSTDCGR